MTDRYVTLQSDHLTVTVDALGAETHALRTAAGRDLLWHGDPAFWSGRAPLLFPIVGRAVDDTVSAGGLRAEMKQHGFARRTRFDLETAVVSGCRHSLRADAVTRAVYPFDFLLSCTHALDGPTLDVSVTVANADTRPMPFGFGFHPAFRWPLPGGEDRPHIVRLAGAGAPRRQPLRPDGLLARTTVPGPFRNGALEITETLFDEGALVFPGGADALSYGPDTGPGLEFRFRNLPDLALWKPPDAPFLCIEPWHGMASRVGDGPEIAARPNALTLAPGATATFGYAVTFYQ